MAFSLNWQPAAFKPMTPLELYSRVRVSNEPVGAIREKSAAVANYGHNNGPQKASLSVLTHTLEDKLQRLNRATGSSKDTQPLLGAVKATINQLQNIYGDAVADMATGMLQQEIQKNGASEMALAGTFDKLISTITNDESLLKKNQELSLKISGQPVEEGQWAGRGLLTLWNAGMNAVRDINGNFENGAGEYWGGDEGLVLRNQTPKGIAHAMAEFYGNNTEEKDAKTILKRTKVFMENGDGLQGAQVMRTSVQWLEHRKPDVSQGVFVDNTQYRNVATAINKQSLQPEIEKAVKYLLEEIKDEQAAHMLEKSATNFIDTALQVLNRVKTNKGEAAARQVINYFNSNFVEKINRTTTYDDSIIEIYGASFHFSGFSDKVLEQVFDDDKDKAPAATSPFYANWAYTDKNGHAQAAAYIGLGENQCFFGKGPGARGNEELKKIENQLQEAADMLLKTLDESSGLKIADEPTGNNHEQALTSKQAVAEQQGRAAVNANPLMDAYLNRKQKQTSTIFSCAA